MKKREWIESLVAENDESPNECPWKLIKKSIQIKEEGAPPPSFIQRQCCWGDWWMMTLVGLHFWPTALFPIGPPPYHSHFICILLIPSTTIILLFFYMHVTYLRYTIHQLNTKYIVLWYIWTWTLGVVVFSRLEPISLDNFEHFYT